MAKYISLTQNKKVLIDDDIYARYHDVPFHASRVKNKFYARTSRTLMGHSIRTYLHQLVIGLPVSRHWQICFKDGNTLNCLKENLIYIRRSDNTQKHSKTQIGRKKTSKYIGVSFRPARYLARIKFDGKLINIGEFENEIDAVKAYNQYAIKCFGDKAKINKLN